MGAQLPDGVAFMLGWFSGQGALIAIWLAVSAWELRARRRARHAAGGRWWQSGK